MVNIDGALLAVELRSFFLLVVQAALALVGWLTLYLVGAWARPFWGRVMLACLVVLAVTCGRTLNACLEGRTMVLDRIERLAKVDATESTLRTMWLFGALSLYLAAVTVAGGRYLLRVG